MIDWRIELNSALDIKHYQKSPIMKKRGKKYNFLIITWEIKYVEVLNILLFDNVYTEEQIIL